MLVHVTVSPTLAWMAVGLNEMFCIFTATPAPAAPVDAGGLAAGVLADVAGAALEDVVELEELELELEPQAASVSATSGNTSTERRFMRRSSNGSFQSGSCPTKTRQSP